MFVMPLSSLRRTFRDESLTCFSSRQRPSSPPGWRRSCSGAGMRSGEPTDSSRIQNVSTHFSPVYVLTSAPLPQQTRRAMPTHHVLGFSRTPRESSFTGTCRHKPEMLEPSELPHGIQLRRVVVRRGQLILPLLRLLLSVLVSEETYIDVLGQEVVASLVLLQDVSVDARACDRAAEEETEEPILRKGAHPIQVSSAP